MTVHNITTKVSWQSEEKWLKWYQEVHISEILKTGLISDCKIFRLLEHDDENGPTYTAQFFFSTMEKYEDYIHNYSPALRKKSSDKWMGQCVSFYSVMQLIK